VNSLFEELINKADRSIEGINVLLERIDYIDDSAKILNLYNDEVKIKDIRTQLITAVDKLKLY